MFEIKLNSKLTSQLALLADDGEAKAILDKGSISMKSLLSFCEKHWEDVAISELMTPLDFVYKTKREKGAHYSEEFKLQLERLRLEQEENEYQSMVRRDGLAVGLQDSDNQTPAQITKQVKEQITTVFNILVSVVSVVFAVWYWTGSSAGMRPQSRVLFCLFGGILVLVAEVVVYSSYLRKVEEARMKERSKKERKTVIKTLT